MQFQMQSRGRLAGFLHLLADHQSAFFTIAAESLADSVGGRFN